MSAGVTQLASAGAPDGGAALTSDEVAAFLERLPALDIAVPDAERIEVIGLLESIKAAAAGAQARVAVAFADSQQAARAAEGVPARRRDRGVAAQVGLARRESPSRGGRHLGLARALTGELPHTMAHLAAGRVSEWRATLVARETASLSVGHRGAVDAALAGALPPLGDLQVAARARALAASLDAAALTTRAAKARGERRVSLRPAPDTMAYLTALLPVEQGVAAYAALHAAAGPGARKPGEERTRGQLMADTLVERITGQAHAESVPVEVHLVMPAASLLAGGAEPAVLTRAGAGMGPQVVPAAWARDLLARASSRQAKAWLRRLFTTPDGADLAAVDSTHRRFEGILARHLHLRDQTCRTPWCDAPIRHADHSWPVAAGGPTTLVNGRGTCQGCNLVKEEPGWRAEVIHPGPADPAATAAPTSFGLLPRQTSREVTTPPRTPPPTGPPTRPPTLPAGAPPHTVRITTPTGHKYDSTAPPVLPSRVRSTGHQPGPRGPDIRPDFSRLEHQILILLEAA